LISDKTWIDLRLKRDELDKNAARKDFKAGEFSEGMSEAYYLEYGALIKRRDNIKEVARSE
jgi:hypothetical protein